MDFVFNVAKGRINQFAQLPGDTDSIVAIPLNAAGLPDDMTLMDAASYDAILTLGASQHSVGSMPLVDIYQDVNYSDNNSGVYAGNPVWVGATGDPIGKLLVCYYPDDLATTATIIPLCAYDWEVVPDGTDLIATFHADGLFRAF